MSDQSAKQKVVDKLKASETVLVTVNTNPSVDELSAALGLTILLNKLNKHATAVFSGDTPPAITFLDPEKTFENTVDSLRDFIIALDKERADHLRYKVEGDMVKIFITPYRTTIDQNDFEFSQGDYNVEMVVAIGVKTEDDLDRALSGHGRILHDATVASISVGEDKTELGTISWHDDDASSYSELLVGLVESLKGSKNPLDEQIANAFLTGIVAATDRFSNPSTSSKTMTVAAQLMAAGANQQLIATKLEEADEIGDQDNSDSADDSKGSESDDGEGNNSNDNQSSMLKVERDEEPESKAEEPIKDAQAADGSMSVSHDGEDSLENAADKVERDRQAEATKKAEAQLASSLASTTGAQQNAIPSVEDLKHDLEKASEEVEEATADTVAPVMPEPVLPAPVAATDVASPIDPDSEPKLGGTLNATSEQAAEDKRREILDDRNKTILSHDSSEYLESPISSSQESSPYNQTVSMTEEKPVAAQEQPDELDSFTKRGKTINPLHDMNEPTLADIDAQNRGQDEARSSIDQALEQNSALNSAGKKDILPPMPDFSTLPDLPPDVPAAADGFIPTPLPVTQSPPAQDNSSVVNPNLTLDQSSSGASANFQPPVAAEQQLQQEKDLTDRLSDILPPAQPKAASDQNSQSADPTQFQIPN